MEVPYQFDFNASSEWMNYLNENGYVVVRGVVDPSVVAQARDQYWNSIEKLYPGVQRNDPESWDKWPLDSRGIVLAGELMHCEGAWMLRSHPNVRSTFATVWETESLIVSFDSPLIWRPWWLQDKDSWRPHCEGLHVDQNPFSKPKRCCVQGMLPLFDVNETTGGLSVVPRSHTDEAMEQLRARCPGMKNPLSGDFCVLKHDDPNQGKQQLLLASAGDLILWDSRTIHGGQVGTGALPSSPEGVPQASTQLCRLSQTICMVPRSTASQSVLKWRRESAYPRGLGTTHWPNERRTTGASCPGFVAPDLTPEIEAVL